MAGAGELMLIAAPTFVNDGENDVKHVKGVFSNEQPGAKTPARAVVPAGEWAVM